MEINRRKLLSTQQITTRHTGINVPSHDIAVGVDPLSIGKARPRDINRRKLLPTQQKTMAHIFTRVLSHDIAAGVDRGSGGEARIREINRRESLLVCPSPRGNTYYEAKWDQI